MKELTTLALSLMACWAVELQAADFTVLETPADVLKYSIEDEAGAKMAFQAVLDNTGATPEELMAAMQIYEQKATPQPGFAFDMSFLLQYNALTEENKATYTKTNLWSAWHTDIEGLNTEPTAQNNTLQYQSEEPSGLNIRIYSSDAFAQESSYGKFLIYQDAQLAAGKYHLTIRSYASGLANGFTLSAGETDGIGVTGKPIKDYSIDFTVSSLQTVKLGLKRNSTAGKLTRAWFNDMYLYKVSPIVVIDDDASGALNESKDVDVQLRRTFKAGQYYPLCLPFVVENWRDVFDDVIILTNYKDGKLVFASLNGVNTQARKPYLVKLREDVTENNYLLFKNVDIQKGGGGTWSVSDNAMVLKGDWASGTVPAGSYYYADGVWKLSDGTAPFAAFSAYISTSVPSPVETLPMQLGETSHLEDLNVASDVVDVYDIHGLMVKRAVDYRNALEGLSRGIYIINGQKILK